MGVIWTYCDLNGININTSLVTDYTPDNSGSLVKQKTIEAPQAILTLGKHGGRTAEMVCASQL